MLTYEGAGEPSPLPATLQRVPSVHCSPGTTDCCSEMGITRPTPPNTFFCLSEQLSGKRDQLSILLHLEQQLRDKEQPMAAGARCVGQQKLPVTAQIKASDTCFLFTFSKSLQSTCRSFSRTYHFTKCGWIFTETPKRTFLTQRIPSSCLIWSLCFVKCKSKWTQPFHFKIYLNLAWQFSTL